MTRTERTILTIAPDGSVTAMYLEPEQVDTSTRLWGWKSIGDAVNRSWRWAQKWGHKGRSGRMPVTWFEGRPTITTRALLVWLERA